MVLFHHVNLGVPVGGRDAEAEFLIDALGYRRLPSPDQPTACWFESADGAQVHLSEDPDHRAADRAHVAVILGGELGGVIERFERTSYEHRVIDVGGGRIVFCRDPAGNLWELRGEA